LGGAGRREKSKITHHREVETRKGEKCLALLVLGGAYRTLTIRVKP